jgi:hypothetical protein
MVGYVSTSVMYRVIHIFCSPIGNNWYLNIPIANSIPAALAGTDIIFVGAHFIDSSGNYYITVNQHDKGNSPTTNVRGDIESPSTEYTFALTTTQS